MESLVTIYLSTKHEIVVSRYEPGEKILPIPCHTQAVDRYVKLVTEASEFVCGQKIRDSFIRATLLSFKKMPTFKTKKKIIVHEILIDL